MKLGSRLRQAKVSAAIVVGIFAASGLLSSCWEVAGPLIGVGAVGTGAAVVNAKGAAKESSEASPAGQGNRVGSRAAAQGGQQQPLDPGSDAVTARLTSAAFTTAMGGAAKALPQGWPPPSGDYVAQPLDPKLPNLRGDTVAAVRPGTSSQASTPPMVIVH